MKNLLIAEKSSAASSIAYILSDGKSKRTGGKVSYFHFTKDGNEYYVMGLRGHIMGLDYSQEYKGWDISKLKELINAEPELKIKEGMIVGTLKQLAKKVDRVIVCTDYDREGELIGVEALNLLDVKDIKRARFSAFTKEEIEKAFDSLEEVDYNLADSAQTRGYVDLMWGAALTRFMSISSAQKGKNYLSVGRVQSPTLALLVKREKEIEKFKPEDYWELWAQFQKNRKFKGIHEKEKFWKKDEIDKIFNGINGTKEATIKKVTQNQRRLYKPAPFNTTEFLREATKLKLSPAKTMKIAEDLYMKGYISYPRTDNTVYPRSLNLKTILNKFIGTDFEKEAKEILTQGQIKPSRGKKETKDHPPIYPVRGVSKKVLKGDNWNVYELVVRRFLATLSIEGIIKETQVQALIKNEKFFVSGREIGEKGWLKYYPYFNVKEIKLPELKEGENVKVLSIDETKKQTRPLSRYTAGSLLKEMEDLNLGTKSTRHEIIQKLYQRKYVRGDSLTPTMVGIAMIESLLENDVDVAKPNMTAELEEDMSKIADGKSTKEKVIKESKDMLLKVLGELQSNEEKIGKHIKQALYDQTFIGKCPECNGDLRVIPSKKGGQFIGCSGYPNCKFISSLPQRGKIIATEKKCQICASPLIEIIEKGKKKREICLTQKCEFNKDKEETIGKCQNCEKNLIVRISRNGKRFIGCMGYPECKVTYPLPQNGYIIAKGEKCDICNAPLISIRKKGKKDWKICINIECEHNKKK